MTTEHRTPTTEYRAMTTEYQAPSTDCWQCYNTELALDLTTEQATELALCRADLHYRNNQ